MSKALRHPGPRHHMRLIGARDETPNLFAKKKYDNCPWLYHNINIDAVDSVAIGRAVQVVADTGTAPARTSTHRQLLHTSSVHLPVVRSQ